MDFFKEILNFSIVDVLDIFLVATLLYYAYKLLKGTVAINIFTGIILIYVLWRGTVFLEMELLSSIIGGFMSVGIIALIVVFQPEIRKFLLMIGSANLVTALNILNQKLVINNVANNNISDTAERSYKLFQDVLDELQNRKFIRKIPTKVRSTFKVIEGNNGSST